MVYHIGRILTEVHDTDKCVSLEARSADQSTIDIGLGHQAINVISLNATAVQDADSIGCGLVRHRCQRRTDSSMHFLGLIGSSRAPGTDRPHRFIGDHQGSERRLFLSLQADLDLASDYGQRVSPLALFEGLAYTHDRRQTVALRRAYFARDLGIALGKILAPFRVTEDDVGAA